MANLKAAIKDLRQTKKRTLYNKAIKDDVKTLIKKTRKAIEAKTDDSKELLIKTCKKLDKASQKKVINKQTVNRKKSRLHLKYNASLETKDVKSATKKATPKKKTTAKKKTVKK
ncbi:30S ribosomal protein S20 [Candidatus Parcubacteria bacterium]|nr:30S ribosomal protein S20 [Candidatus Parcubacteria bacterium]